MTHYKLQLEEDADENYVLIAIHCSEEPYKMAFMLNKHLSIQLQRSKDDLQLSTKEYSASFSIFEFEKEQQCIQFYLFENKCILSLEKPYAMGGLFERAATEKTTIAHVLPEFKKVDYFLKIESDEMFLAVRKILAQLNEINEVISAYTIENSTIKSHNNLIFN
ncbi:MAG: IPExxxVDY family protein [Flavobacteriaceae bacterium]